MFLKLSRAAEFTAAREFDGRVFYAKPTLSAEPDSPVRRSESLHVLSAQKTLPNLRINHSSILNAQAHAFDGVSLARFFQLAMSQQTVDK